MATSTVWASVDFERKFNLATKQLILRPILEWLPGMDETMLNGISFKCVGPGGTVFHQNDITVAPDADINSLPDMTNTTTYTTDLPVFSSLIEFNGAYTITMNAEDSDGVVVSVEKSFTLCMPECDCEDCDCPPSNDGKSSLTARVDCDKAKLIVVDKTAYVYNGVESTDITYLIKVYSPVELELAPVIGTIPYFSVVNIYSGEYNITMANTASYTFDDNNIVVVGYNQKIKITAACALDLCEANCAFDTLFESWKSENAAFPGKAKKIEAKLLKAGFLFTIINNKQKCGEDVSDEVAELNKLLGTNCSCSCPTKFTATPASICCDIEIGVTGVPDDITVTQTTSGNTINFLIGNKKIYLVTRDTANTGVLTVTQIFTATQKEFKITLDYAALATELVDNQGMTTQALLDAETAARVAEDSAINALIIAPLEWHALPINTGTATDWQNASLTLVTFQPAEYAIDYRGTVFLRGTLLAANSPSTPDLMATLPINNRPPADVFYKTYPFTIFPAAVPPYGISINAAGEMYLEESTGAAAVGSTLIPLDGISFNVNA